MKNVIKYILIGFVQGITEFLPVSSSGHLAIYQHFFGDTSTSGAMFSVMLHLGTLFAVCLVYRKTISALIVEFCRMIIDIFTGKFSFKNMNIERRTIFMMIISSAMLLTMFIPEDSGIFKLISESVALNFVNGISFIDVDGALTRIIGG